MISSVCNVQRVEEVIVSPDELLQTTLPGGLGKIKGSTTESWCALRNALLTVEHSGTGCISYWQRVIVEYFPLIWKGINHYDDVIMSTMASQITSLAVVYSTVSKKTSKLRVTGLCVGNSPGPVNSPHKGPVTRKMFPFDDVIMQWRYGLDS